MTAEALHQLECVLWPAQSGRHAWMILDAARDTRIFPMLLECHLDYSCLYSGTLPPLLSMAAPYLVHLEYEYRDTRRFLRHAWGNSWGILLDCQESMKSVRRHLRELLLVRDPAGQPLLFRYYDPRVLRIYLPTCTNNELRTVFGPVRRFWLEDQAPDILIAFGLVDRGLSAEKITLDAHHSE
jgi:hypothetical protein